MLVLILTRAQRDISSLLGVYVLHDASEIDAAIYDANATHVHGPGVGACESNESGVVSPASRLKHHRLSFACMPRENC